MSVLCWIILWSQVAFSYQQSDFPKWNHLSVTFRKFSALPMNVDDAERKGWELIADNCVDRSGPFHGKRYMLNGEYATILIFDVYGHVAGMQMAFETKLKKGGGYRKNAAAFQEIAEKHGKYYYITAYFMDPKEVCDEEVKRAKNVIGDKLIFLVGKDKYMEAPLVRKDAGTKWKEGSCYPMMGLHYWYDVSNDMDCDDMFPFFLMYNKNDQLHAFGYATNVLIPGGRVEHVPAKYLWIFFKKDTYPYCFAKKQSHRSTQHVYLTKVDGSSHLC